ncbi:kinase-like domain-containing protein [Globomyces pollinis-pini]|nr:kinase-like domain-containing protein [Globomyces pollinis-pini]
MLTQQKSRDTIVDDSGTRRNSELNHGQNNESGTFVYKNQDQSVSNRSYGTRSPLNTETNRSYPDHFESHNHSNIIHSRSNTQFDSNNNNSHFNPNNTSYSHRSHSQSDHYHSNPDTLLNSSLSPTYNLDPTKDTVIPVSTMYDVRLQITKKIAGSGGEGTVYLAIYDGKKAVAKIPTNQNHQKDVFYESQMMSTLRCPWVVESLAFMSDAMIQIPNQPDLRRTALIIEFMNLGALSKYLIPQPPLQKETEYHLVNNITLKLMKDVTKGMEFIHQLSYIHLDIKPDNVLLCQQDDGVIAKLSDFGSCRRNGTQDQVYQTKGYIPPEIRISPIVTIIRFICRKPKNMIYMHLVVYSSMS